MAGERQHDQGAEPSACLTPDSESRPGTACSDFNGIIGDPTTWQPCDHCTCGGRLLVELLEYEKANSTVLLVKHFSGSVSGRKWPQMEACYVYLPVEDGNLWDGLDKALTEYEQRLVARTDQPA